MLLSWQLACWLVVDDDEDTGAGAGVAAVGFAAVVAVAVGFGVVVADVMPGWGCSSAGTGFGTTLTADGPFNITNCYY